jgi:hypothetical protein
MEVTLDTSGSNEKLLENRHSMHDVESRLQKEALKRVSLSRVIPLRLEHGSVSREVIIFDMRRTGRDHLRILGCR